MADESKKFESGLGEEPTADLDPTVAEPVGASDIEIARARQQAAEEAQQDATEEVEGIRQESGNEIRKMVSEMVARRKQLMPRLRSLSREGRQDLMREEAKVLAGTFSEREQFAVVGKFLPHIADAETKRLKFQRIAEMCLMSRSDSQGIQYRIEEKIGAGGVQKNLEEEEERIIEALYQEFPELDEEIEELQAAA